jgi:hypothetical protein
MPSLMDAALGYHRALAVAAMPDRATRRRPVKVDDGQGGETDGPPDLSLSFPCRLYGQGKTPFEPPQAGRIVSIMQWTMAIPHGTDLKPSDEVIVKGQVFEVIDDADKRSSAVTMWVNLREVR